MNETPSGPPAAPAKKGMPALGWVGIGCGTLLVIALVIGALMVSWFKGKVGDLSEFKKNPEKATAEMMVRLNPDLKLVSQDEAKGEMTIRTKDGSEMTMNYKDVAAGKFTFKDAKGNVSHVGQSDLSDVPAWVPRVPKQKSANGSVHNQEEGKISGLYTATSSDSVSALEKFFKGEAEKLKLNSANSTSSNSDGAETRMITYSGEGRQLNIVINGKSGEDVQVNVGYEETK